MTREVLETVAQPGVEHLRTEASEWPVVTFTINHQPAKPRIILMRRIYFILFALVLLALILLVDWRERWQQLTGAHAPEPLGQMLAPTSDQLLDAQELPPAVDLNNSSAEGLMPEDPPSPDDPGPMENALTDPAYMNSPAVPTNSLFPMPPSSSGRAAALQRAPRRVAASPPPFQDVPDQPYREESRRLLNTTMSHYRRISPSVQSEPQP